MPCFISIIQYRRCGHNILFKLNCTENCDTLCPLEKQRTLLLTKSLWQCEECHNWRWVIVDNDRSDYWDQQHKNARRLSGVTKEEQDNELVVEAEQLPVSSASMATWAWMKEHLAMRMEVEDRRMEQDHLGQTEEIQLAADWTFRYGKALYEYVSEQGAQQQKAEAVLQRLRLVPLWDMLVVRDASRGRAQLESDQRNQMWLVLRRCGTIGPSSIVDDVRQNSNREGQKGGHGIITVRNEFRGAKSVSRSEDGLPASDDYNVANADAKTDGDGVSDTEAVGEMRIKPSIWWDEEAPPIESDAEDAEDADVTAAAEAALAEAFTRPREAGQEGEGGRDEDGRTTARDRWALIVVD